jgi:hypothetical protein
MINYFIFLKKIWLIWDIVRTEKGERRCNEKGRLSKKEEEIPSGVATTH